MLHVIKYIYHMQIVKKKFFIEKYICSMKIFPSTSKLAIH